MGKKKKSRRKFIKDSGKAVISISVFESLAGMMVEGMIAKAHAAEVGATNVHNYIYLCLRGGPARWHYDLPLKPNGAGDIVGANPQLITHKTDGYKTIKIGEYYLPHMWSDTIPTVGGGPVAMAGLASNMIMFRGIDQVIDGHTANQVRQTAPVAGQPSIGGLLADVANTPIPAVYNYRTQGYKSAKGVGIVNGFGHHYGPFYNLLSSFSGTPASFGKGDNIDNLINKSMDSLKEYGRGRTPKVKALFNDLTNSKALFLKSFGDLRNDYTAMLAKYEKLVADAICQNSLDGVDLTPLVVSDNTPMFNGLASGSTSLLGSDLRDSIVRNEVSQGAAALPVSGHKDSSVGSLASVMALCEFCLINDVSSSLTLNISDLNYLLKTQVVDSATVYTNHKFWTNDSHSGGTYPSLLYSTKYFRAISACLYEIRAKLQAKPVDGGGNVFDKTVFHIAGDFNRNPISSGGGSDHGYKGGVATLFTGMTTQLEVVGNIEQNNSNNASKYPGGWGSAAPLDELGGRPLSLGNVASSIAALLEINSPAPNDAPLLKKESGKAVVLTGKPKNV